MKSEKSTYIILLIGIALFGLIVRIVGLDRVPTGISSDILLYFSNARAIAETGKDIYGHIFPLYFSHKGYLISPVTVYVTALVYKLFGFSHVAGYVPNIVMSVLSIVIAALLATRITGQRRIGVITALFVAISPWHYHLSRTGFEGVFGFSLVLVGIYCSILAIKKPILFVLSVMLFTLATFSYKAINIFLLAYPIIFAFTIGWKRVKGMHSIVFAISIWIVIFLQWFLLFTYYHDTYASGIVNNNLSRAALDANSERVQSDAPRILRIIASNTPLSLERIVIANYTHFFSPQYLLTIGDGDLRFSTGGHGQLYLLDVFLIVGGVVWLVKTKRKTALMFLTAIIFTAPLAALVSDEEYAIRTFIALFAFAIFGGCGIELLITSRMPRFRRNVLLGALGFLYAVSFALYLYRYHFLYIHYVRLSWDYGDKEVFKEAYTRSPDYTRITFGQTSEFEYLGFMYWNSLPVQSIQRALSSYNERTLTYGNVNFVRDCSYEGNVLVRGTLNENELLYTTDTCFKDIEPIHRYYLPKTMLWRWKTYTEDWLQKNYYLIR
jgi:4-amino-4-deoxy-L-arabinose transferase-like glycosyltransferase